MITKFINAAFIPYVETEHRSISDVQLSYLWNTISSKSQINTKVRLSDTYILDTPFLNDFYCPEALENQTPAEFTQMILDKIKSDQHKLVVVQWRNDKTYFANSQTALEIAANIKRSLPHVFVVLGCITTPVGVVKAAAAGLDGVAMGLIYEYSVQQIMALRQAANGMGSNIKIFASRWDRGTTYDIPVVLSAGVDAILGHSFDDEWMAVMATRGYPSIRSLVNDGLFILRK